MADMCKERLRKLYTKLFKLDLQAIFASLIFFSLNFRITRGSIQACDSILLRYTTIVLKLVFAFGGFVMLAISCTSLVKDILSHRKENHVQ